MSRNPLPLLSACLLPALLLSACGQTGDLVLPDRKPPVAARPALAPAPAAAVPAAANADQDPQNKKAPAAAPQP